MTDDLITAAQCRAARALVGINQAELAGRANVARQTVVDFERGARMPYANNLVAIKKALEDSGVEFIPENGGGAGLRFSKPG